MARESGVPQGEAAVEVAGEGEQRREPAERPERPLKFVVPSGLSEAEVLEHIRRRYGVALDGQGY